MDTKKSAESYLTYSLSRGSGKPYRKNKQHTPTLNMIDHQAEQSTNGCSAADHIPKDVLVLSYFGRL